MQDGEILSGFYCIPSQKTAGDVYRNNCEACFSFVRHISEHVPCHVCRMESRVYLSKVDCEELQTKECFKLFLFMFHNDVNRRLGKRLFTLSELNNYERYGDDRCASFLSKQS